MHVSVQFALVGTTIPEQDPFTFEEIKEAVENYLETPAIYWDSEELYGVNIYALCVFWDSIKKKLIVKPMTSFLNTMSIDKKCFRMAGAWDVKVY